jgi:hypothetical protein
VGSAILVEWSDTNVEFQERHRQIWRKHVTSLLCMQNAHANIRHMTGFL